jgi:hypothetical protein
MMQSWTSVEGMTSLRSEGKPKCSVEQQDPTVVFQVLVTTIEAPRAFFLIDSMPFRHASLDL